MLGLGGFARLVGRRGCLSALLAITSLVACWLVATSICALASDDLAIVGIDYDYALEDLVGLVVPQGGAVDVVTLLANTGDATIGEAIVQYLYYENEVTGAKWKVPDVQAAYSLSPYDAALGGPTTRSTVYRWDTTDVDPGRYHFVARAGVEQFPPLESASAEGLCDNFFPRLQACSSSVFANETQSVVVRLPDDILLQLFQPLSREVDPVPPTKAGVRVLERCILGYDKLEVDGRIESIYTGQYAVTVVNVGSVDIEGVQTPTSSARTSIDAQFEEKEGLVRSFNYVLSAGGGSAPERYNGLLTLDLKFLADSVKTQLANEAGISPLRFDLASYPEFNAARAYDLQLRLDLFAEQFADPSVDESLRRYASSEYNRILLPSDPLGTLAVYAPVVEMLWPECGAGASDEVYSVYPEPGKEFLAGVRNLYVPVSSADQYDLLTVEVDVEHKTKHRLVGLPAAVIGLAADRTAGLVYLVCADGSVVAAEDGFTQSEIVWQWNDYGDAAGNPAPTAPVLYSVEGITYVLFGTSDGLRIVWQASSEGALQSRYVETPDPIVSDLELIGHHVYFRQGTSRIGWVALQDIEGLEEGSVTVGDTRTPIETGLSHLDLGAAGSFAVFGGADGKVYCLKEGEPVNRGLRDQLLQATPAGSITAVAAVAAGSVGYVFAGSDTGSVYRVPFDGNSFGDEATLGGLLEEPTFATAFLPEDRIHALAVYEAASVDGSVADSLNSIWLFVASSELVDPEQFVLRGYTGAFDEVLHCRLWDPTKTVPFSMVLPNAAAPEVDPVTKTLFIRSDATSGSTIYGLDLEFLVNPSAGGARSWIAPFGMSEAERCDPS
jgi:hypothetical protein